MTQVVNDTEQSIEELLLSDIDIMTELVDYLQTKYLTKVSYDKEFIYIDLKISRLTIPIGELTSFINENYEQYEELDFIIFDLVDVYIVTVLTEIINTRINSEFQNVPEILLQ